MLHCLDVFTDFPRHSRSANHSWWRAVCLTLGLAAVAACSGCGSAGPAVEPAAGLPPVLAEHAGAGWPSALPQDHAQPWEQLDAAGRVIPAHRQYPAGAAGRSAASINADTEYVPGVERFMQGGDVTDLSEATRLASGIEGAHQSSYALYQISLGPSQPGVIAADINLRLQHGGTGLSGFYIGLSNYSRGRWDWSGPFTDHHVRLSTGFNARWGLDYTSPLGRLYVCVLAYDGADFDVIGVGTNALDTVDVTAPPAPGGLTATPAANALVLQWNAAIAADLAGYRIYWRKAAFTSPGDPGVVQVDYLEGATLHVLPLPASGPHAVAVSAVDLNGNESAISTVLSAAPLAGSAPVLQVTVSATDVQLGDPATLTATGALSYDFDTDGDGVFDLTNALGTASVDTTAAGLVRPAVRGTTGGGSAVALGGVSLIVTGNTRPAASALASPQTGIAPLTVAFTGTAQDLEDLPGALTYAWDYNDDGVYDAGSNTLTPAPYTYNPPGMWNVKFRVTDSDGAWDVDTVTVIVEPKEGVEQTVVQQCSVARRDKRRPDRRHAGHRLSRDSASHDIYFIKATRADGTTWGSPVEVANAADLLKAIDLQVVNGNPAIVFSDQTNHDVNFVRAANAQGTAWGAPVTVVAADSVGSRSELVIAAGNPGIGYFNDTALRANFVRAIDANGAAWAAPVPVDVVGTGQACSTAIVDGYPAMAYSNTAADKTFFCRATDAAGSAWGVPVEISAFAGATATDLQLISGVPCMAYTGAATSVVYFARAKDLAGAAWWGGQIAARRPAGSINPSAVTLAEFDGHAALAITDQNPDWLWYVEANDPTGMHWGWPEVIAPWDVDSTVTGKPSLLNVNGLAEMVYYSYDTATASSSLYLSRKYR